jgi:hypothetical protein
MAPVTSRSRRGHVAANEFGIKALAAENAKLAMHPGRRDGEPMMIWVLTDDFSILN